MAGNVWQASATTSAVWRGHKAARATEVQLSAPRMMWMAFLSIYQWLSNRIVEYYEV
jgi:hypothetical protein